MLSKVVSPQSSHRNDVLSDSVLNGLAKRFSLKNDRPTDRATTEDFQSAAPAGCGPCAGLGCAGSTC